MIDGKEFRKYAIHNQGVSGSAIDDYSNHIENMTRSVIEERPTRFAEIDVFSRLIMDRIIFLGMGVDDNVANIITAQLLFLESVDPNRDIVMYINSPGGSVYAGLGMYDTMQFVKPDVATICTGMAASMGAVLLAGGAAKKRAALKHSRIMIHQPSGGARGQASNIEIQAREIIKTKELSAQLLADNCGQKFDKVLKDFDRDYWMSAEESVAYGIVDGIMK